MKRGSNDFWFLDINVQKCEFLQNMFNDFDYSVD